MGRHYIILTSVFVFVLHAITFAHQDFRTGADFGNVKVRIQTGFHYEEIAKVLIIGQLVEHLSKKMGYQDTLFLDFDHNYTKDCVPDYFVSFDKGSISYTYTRDPDKDYLTKPALVVRQVGRSFDVETTLKLVEYAIMNKTKVRTTQKSITYNKNYCQCVLNSMDTSLLKRVAQETASTQVTETLSKRIERPTKEFEWGMSYFFKNNNYHIYFRNYVGTDTVLLSLGNIYQFSELTTDKALVFDTDSSFFYLGIVGFDWNANRQVISNTYDYYEPFKVVRLLGDGKVSINMIRYTDGKGSQPKSQTSLYLPERDTLIQDLDELIDLK